MAPQTVDLSLPDYAALRQQAGVDPDAEVARLTTARPADITSASATFTAAGGEMDAAREQSMAAQGVLGDAFRNNGGEVYDRTTHLASLPLGFLDSGTQLVDAGGRLTMIAESLVTQTGAAVERRNSLIGELQADAAAWRARVQSAGTLEGGLIPESAIPGLLAERDRIAQQMVGKVTTAGGDIVAMIGEYEGAIADGLRLLADQGFITPEEIEAARTAVPQPVTYAGDPDAPGYVDPIGLGTPLMAGYAADPVNTALGNFVEIEADLPFTGPAALLSFVRTYNSRADGRRGPFGPRWASWASARLVATPAGAEFVAPDGQCATFPRVGEGFGRAVGVDALVERDPSGLLTLAWFDGRRWDFNAAGRPLRVSAGPGTGVGFAHDASGRLVEMSHVWGRRVVLTWDGDRVTGLTSSDGRTVTYDYDAAGHLVEADVPAGVRRYGIDPAGLVATVTDADGVVELVNSYDGVGRVVSQRSPFGRLTSFEYLPGDVTVTSDETGGPSNRYLHDRAGRLVGAVDGHGETFRKVYDEEGNPVRVIDRGGAVTVQDWDERARMVRRVLPSEAEHLFTYDDADRLVAAAVRGADIAEAVTTYRYDGDERMPSEIVDPEGGVTRLRIADGLVQQVTDADGVSIRFGHDADGNVVEVVDAAGGVARVERDAAGRAVAVTTPGGRRTELGHDHRGLLVLRREPDGAVWRAEYTAAGRLAAVVDPLGARTEVRHGEHGAAAEVVDPLGAVTTRSYDLFGNLAGVTADDGAKWTFTYDGLSRLTAWSDPAGAMWLRNHDVDGHPTALVDPTGTTVSMPRDAAGRVSEVHDGLVARTFTRDVLGRVLVEHRPDGTEVRSSYDRCGRRIAETGPDGGTTRFTYSPAGRLLAVTSPAGRTESYVHDRCGRLATRIDGAGAREELRYDADGYLVERISPSGLSETLAYDAAGRLAGRVTPGRGVARYAYDAAGRVTAVTDRRAGTRRFGYDAVGRLTEAVDALGHATRFRHDERGRLTATTDPLGGTTTRTYDETGHLLSLTDPLGQTTRFAYDPAGRLVASTDPAGGTRRVGYDAAGRLVALSGTADSGSVEVGVERDPMGRVVRVTEPGRDLQERRYDAAGRLVEHRRGDLAMTWAYDADGLRSALGHPDGTETGYLRDAAGRIAALHHPALGEIRLDRDPDGRLTDLHARDLRTEWRFTGGELTGHRTARGDHESVTRLVRDDTGRVTHTDTDGTVRVFGYDTAGQLVSAAGPDGDRTFTYDPAGRLVHETGPGGGRSYAYDLAGRLLAAGPDRFGYDAAGRRTTHTGPLGRREHGWDALGRPTHVTTVLAATGAIHTTTLVVDALGELAAVDGVPVMWDSADPALPIAGIGGSAVVGDGRPWAVVPPLTGDDPWLTPDWQDTPSALASPDPWGAVTGSGPGYRGELAVDGLLWLRHRIYDPATRTFLSTDPLAAIPGTPYAANPYHYAGNDPLGQVDPQGLQPMTDADLAAQRDQGGGGGLLGGLVDLAGDGLRTVAGGALVLTGVAGSLPGVPGVNPLHTVTGLFQAGATVANGDFDLGHIARNFVNGPTTTFGLGLGLIGDAKISYDDTSGLWVAEESSTGYSRGGTTYGSTFVTPQTDPGDRLLHHESIHAEQYARYGGGIGFPIAYGVEEFLHPGKENRFEREAGLEDGGYR